MSEKVRELYSSTKSKWKLSFIFKDQGRYTTYSRLKEDEKGHEYSKKAHFNRYVTFNKDKKFKNNIHRVTLIDNLNNIKIGTYDENGIQVLEKPINETKTN